MVPLRHFSELYNLATSNPFQSIRTPVVEAVARVRGTFDHRLLAEGVGVRPPVRPSGGTGQIVGGLCLV